MDEKDKIIQDLRREIEDLRKQKQELIEMLQAYLKQKFPKERKE